MDIQSVDSDQSKIDKLIDIVNKHLKFVPGVSLGIIKENGVYIYTAGNIANASDELINQDTLFSLSSVTKVLTTILVMRLMEKKKVELDHLVYQYLPNFKFRNLEQGGKITVGHLLMHASGLDSIFPCFYKKSDESLKDHVLNTVSKIIQVSEPGNLFNYSSANFNLLGFICEQVTGQAFEDLINQYVAVPLGINKIQFACKELYRDRNVAVGHIYKNRKLEQVPYIEYNPAFHPSTQVFMNIGDLSKIVQLLLNDGFIDGKKYLNPASVALMKTPKVKVFTASGDYFGYGLCIKESGKRQFIHEGNGMGYYSKIFLLPNQKIGIAMLSNSSMYGLSSKITHHIVNSFGADLDETNEHFPNLSYIHKNYIRHQFYNHYYAADATGIIISMYYEEQNLYLDYVDTSRGTAVRKKIVRYDRGRYSIVMGTELKKIAIIKDSKSNLVRNIIIATVCFHPMIELYETEKALNKYCGVYVGQFENSQREERIEICFSENSELVMSTEDNTKYILHTYQEIGFFSSAFGIVEFEERENQIWGVRIKYMQYFRKVKNG